MLVLDTVDTQKVIQPAKGVKLAGVTATKHTPFQAGSTLVSTPIIFHSAPSPLSDPTWIGGCLVSTTAESSPHIGNGQPA